MRHKIFTMIKLISLEQTYLRIRFWYYWIFRKDYVLNGIKKFKGKCQKSCSVVCCGYFSCDKFNWKTGRCNDYANRPLICRYGTFDEKSKSRRIKNICKLHW